ncbi:MAG: hypothetical protein MZV64_08425 [Ignavibacteriales bacterium]|nr:hypothetical protein [Ignavibacteriales bacterium]
MQKEKLIIVFALLKDLNSLKEEQQKQKLPQAKYDKHCLHLSKEEIENKLEF